MDAGLDYLALHDALPADQRSALKEIQKFKERERAVDKEVTDELWPAPGSGDTE